MVSTARPAAPRRPPLRSAPPAAPAGARGRAPPQQVPRGRGRRGGSRSAPRPAPGGGAGGVWRGGWGALRGWAPGGAFPPPSPCPPWVGCHGDNPDSLRRGGGAGSGVCAEKGPFLHRSGVRAAGGRERVRALGIPPPPAPGPPLANACERRSLLAPGHCWLPPRVTIRIVPAGGGWGWAAVRGAQRCLLPGSCGDAGYSVGQIGKEACAPPARLINTRVCAREDGGARHPPPAAGARVRLRSASAAGGAGGSAARRPAHPCCPPAPPPWRKGGKPQPTSAGETLLPWAV